MDTVIGPVNKKLCIEISFLGTALKAVIFPARVALILFSWHTPSYNQRRRCKYKIKAGYYIVNTFPAKGYAESLTKPPAFEVEIKVELNAACIKKKV